MKKFKSFLTAIVLLFVACATPMILAGCAKTYTVDVSIVGGNNNGGWVYHKSNTQSISAYGENAVTGGEKFVVYVAPSDGYEIESITVNGEPYGKIFDKAGSYITTTIEEDTSIVVAFQRSTYSFKLLASTYNQAGSHTGYAEYTGYTLTAKMKDVITLAEFDPAELPLETAHRDEYIAANGVFFWESSLGEIIYVDIDEGFTINDDSYIFRTWLTAEELDELIKPVYTVSIADATDYSEAEEDEVFGTIQVTGDNEVIDGSKDYELKQGKTLSFYVHAKAGYVIDKIFENGAEYSGFAPGDIEHFLTVEVNENKEYRVTFKKLPENQGAGND